MQRHSRSRWLVVSGVCWAWALKRPLQLQQPGRTRHGERLQMCLPNLAHPPLQEQQQKQPTAACSPAVSLLRYAIVAHTSSDEHNLVNTCDSRRLSPADVNRCCCNVQAVTGGLQAAPSQPAAERCPQCGSSFRTLQELLFHVEAYHPDGRASSGMSAPWSSLSTLTFMCQKW